MEIRSRLDTLLTHSNLVYHDFSDSAFVLLGPSSYWEALPDDAKSLQWDLQQDTRRWFDLVTEIVGDRGESAVEQTKATRAMCESAIKQSDAMWARNTEEFAQRLWTELTALMATVKGLYSESQRPTFVPDTNALIANPALEEWDFGLDGTIFEVILTPTVLSELDNLKGGRSDMPRTEKAQRVVRQIKEYQRRGPLLKGVVLRTGRSVVSSIAAEPNFKRTLSWLDPSVADDRLLASTLEVVKRRLHAPVLVVTGDVGLQNKLTMAGLPFVERPVSPGGVSE